ncbi:hypothetical protein LTR28_004468 [Elasticomyces elasticus]|nr:hypothetical protein LTR28_004468 [Elasticomyces elasticus]
MTTSRRDSESDEDADADADADAKPTKERQGEGESTSWCRVKSEDNGRSASKGTEGPQAPYSIPHCTVTYAILHMERGAQGTVAVGGSSSTTPTPMTPIRLGTRSSKGGWRALDEHGKTTAGLV